jgi:hypothetical protein
LPKEYLLCETSDLMKMPDDEMVACRKQMEKHQRGVNKMLGTASPK